MAEETLYQSGVGSATAKRKYDDPTAPPPPSSARRASGFSAPIIPSQSPDSAPSYTSVPPPLDEFQLAKQRAQEIAARIFNNAEAKRPKFENGGSGGFDSNDYKSFSSGPTDFGQKSMLTTAPSMPSSYGYGNPSKKIEIPNGRVGVIIGKAGETIKYLQLQSGAKIQVTRDMDADPHSLTRAVELTGSADAIAKAEQLINDVLAEAESGGSGVRRVTGQTGGAEQFVMKVPNNKVGLVIGKGGDTIKNMQASTGARIQVIPLHLPPGDTSTERTVQIDGSSDQIEAAKQLVNEVISENRLRNPTAARPPSYGAPPGPQMQQQGYGYVQPGQPTYTQPPYTGYATGWDQSATAPTTQGAGGYDYYNQQQTQPPVGSSGPTDTLAYGYNQQGQAYNQDGYGGYAAAPQSGYGAQADNGNQAPPPVTAAQPGHGQDASPNPGYPPQGSTAVAPSSQLGYGYGGYGPPPVSQPAGGAAQSGYGQPASYPGGAYGTQGYAYGAPPASYGGLQPPAYGGSYGGGGGYPQQAPAYSSDAAAAPAAQPSGGGAIPKASPQQS